MALCSSRWSPLMSDAARQDVSRGHVAGGQGVVRNAAAIGIRPLVGACVVSRADGDHGTVSLQVSDRPDVPRWAPPRLRGQVRWPTSSISRGGR